MSIAGPRQIRALSLTGKPKAGYIFKMLRIDGYEPFDPIGMAYAEERIRHDDGTWTDVQLRTDLRGVPIQRASADGKLLDITWWHGPASTLTCQGCTIADGQVRPIVRTTRPARVTSHNRIPVKDEAGPWHVACLKVKLANWGRYGRDVTQMASS